MGRVVSERPVVTGAGQLERIIAEEVAGVQQGIARRLMGFLAEAGTSLAGRRSHERRTKVPGGSNKRGAGGAAAVTRVGGSVATGIGDGRW